ncbi:NAD(P)-binding protein [Trichodelitschia bisporula]|uniref:NAD(P)-binding protein n=1 Tax=Trichodelitschia bisporula TaxID=703511 RepID=A0A6G1I188_9PEZI|nr:NAD(P)-binding protein [Trichodelitschia bisporula]
MLQTAPKPSPHAPRILTIGAGSQGHAYAGPIAKNGWGHIACVAEPIPYKRAEFGGRFIWGLEGREALPWEQFVGWEEWLAYEKERRGRVATGEIREGDPEFRGVDAVFVCVLDEMHVRVVKAVAPLGLHIMCEKPLATSLEDCIDILGTVTREWNVLGKKSIFGIGHVLRYSPQNVTLRRLVREERVIGDVISMEHTEPVGWWHMAHSFVRGNWRREDVTAPILLTKSCHDMDFLLWLLSAPTDPSKGDPPHMPALITSTGMLTHFRKSRKPLAAGPATNCLSCPIEQSCIYSAKNVYIKHHFDQNDLEWPLKVVVPEIEDLYKEKGKDAAKARLLEALAVDYTSDTPASEVKQRSWYGRCVWECDNNVCDDQTVTISWEDDPLPEGSSALNGTTEETNGFTKGDAGGLNGRAAKTAIFHMTAPTESVCERRGRIYGTAGEITYDFDTIFVHSFATGKTETVVPEGRGGGHGGGDDALAENFCKAVQAVLSGEMDAEESQKRFVGCGIEEIVRHHIAVFAAERARRRRLVVDWNEFWELNVEPQLRKVVLGAP